MQIWDNPNLCVVRSAQGKKVLAKMSQGEFGLVMAAFQESSFETEVPNLILHEASRHKAAKKKPATKRPAGSVSTAAEAPPAAPDVLAVSAGPAPEVSL